MSGGKRALLIGSLFILFVLSLSSLAQAQTLVGTCVNPKIGSLLYCNDMNDITFGNGIFVAAGDAGKIRNSSATATRVG